jgi:Superinfection immunity protein
MINMGLIAVLATLVLILLVLGLYWLPSILGWYRHRPDLFTVVVVNALLGWTMVGWVIALSRALRTTRTHLATEPYLPGYKYPGRHAQARPADPALGRGATSYGPAQDPGSML